MDGPIFFREVEKRRVVVGSKDPSFRPLAQRKGECEVECAVHNGKDPVVEFALISTGRTGTAIWSQSD